MLIRTISSIVGVMIAVAAMFVLDTLWFNLIVGIIAAVAVYELLLATKYLQNKPLTAISLIFVLIVPFFSVPLIRPYRNSAFVLFVFALFVLLLIMHDTMRIEQVGLVLMVSTLVPFSLSTLIYIRDAHLEHAVFFVVLAMLGAWAGDTGAYLVGNLIGKHKLAPNISPKKTIEGAIGGAVTTALAFVAAGAIYRMIDPGVTVYFPALAVLGLVATVFGIMGDLSASIIKRQCAIKDFGNIMPGHGGILDRFDSLLFVAPFMMAALNVVKVVA